MAGCDSIIRSFNIETGNTKMYQGHRGWVYALEIHEERLYSGGDDRSIIIWDIETTKILETLLGHDNGITSISFAFHDLYTGSFDHHVICWDLQEINERIEEKQELRHADVESRRIELYNKLMNVKSKKKGKKGGKGAKGKGKKK